MGQRIEMPKHIANVSRYDIIAEKDCVYGLTCAGKLHGKPGRLH